MYALIGLLIVAVSAWLISIKSKEAYQALITTKEEKTATQNERTVRYHGKLKFN